MARKEGSDTRDYRMGKRLEDVADTRRRIVEAAVELHESVGPANTTFSAVAERAGVQRSTVYRHFPDDNALFGACTSHWAARNPFPRVEDWVEVPDGKARLRKGLSVLYRFYEANRRMLANSIRDLEMMPAFVGEMMRAQMKTLADSFAEPFNDIDKATEAAIGLAIDFRTWSALADFGLDAGASADLVSRMVASIPAGEPGRNGLAV